MKVRFKPFEEFKIHGYEDVYPLSVEDCGTFVRLTDTSTGSIDIDVRQWAQLVSMLCIEDVPEPKSPGQRLFEEIVRDDGGTMQWAWLPRSMQKRWHSRAERLGIKPEDES